MNGIGYFNQAKLLKGEEAQKKAEIHSAEINYEQERSRARQIQDSLVQAEQELDSCQMPSQEDIENGDYRDEEKANALRREIYRLKNELKESEERQQNIRESIKGLNVILNGILDRQNQLRQGILASIDIHTANIDVLNINVRAWNHIHESVIAHCQNELTILCDANQLLNSDVRVLIPSLGRYLDNSNSPGFAGLSSLGTLIHAATLAITGQHVRLMTTLFMPFIKPLLFDMVSEQDSQNRFGRMVKNIGVLAPFHIFSYLCDNFEFHSHYSPGPSYFERTWKNVLYGNYADVPPTKASIFLNIMASFTPLDTPMDLRDLAYDIQNFKTVSKFQFSLDLIGAVPIVGAFKKIGSVPDVIDVMTELEEPVIHFTKNYDEIGYNLVKSIDDSVESVADFVGEGSKIINRTSNQIIGISNNEINMTNALYYASEATDNWEQSLLKSENSWRKTIIEDDGIEIVKVHNDIKIDDFYKNITPRKNIAYSIEVDGGIKYVPDTNHSVAQLLKEYGVDGVVYRNGRPDFSPFTIIDTPWGKINCDVKIGHFSSNRGNIGYYGGKRLDAYDVNTGLGNFKQAEYELARRINSEIKGVNIDPNDVQQWIESSKCYTWHDADIVTGRMQLIPKEIHDFFRHTGAISDAKFANSLNWIDDEWIQVTTLNGNKILL